MSSEFNNASALIYSLKQGDQTAYKYLLKVYYTRLFNYAVSLTHDRAMAQDVIHEVFMNIWRDRKNLHESYNLRSYIYKMTYHKFVNQFHKNRTNSTVEKVYMEALQEAVDN
ncbi:MAG: RNA polymerase sigma factor, partial [Jejuia sp.]